jgi:guanosine-3',5'-bis(diphosphate) 3'-pyrophosphohydrolase
MDIVRPEMPVSRASENLATPDSEAGKELEVASGAASAQGAGSVMAGPGMGAAASATAAVASATAAALDGPSGELAPLVASLESAMEPQSGYDDLDIRFLHLLATVRANRPSDDLDLIRRAWAFCIEKHGEQKRASGDPYIGHPLEVAQVLAEFKMDATAIAAGLLHDAVEDTDVTAADIAKQFGEQVAHIVEGVTKLDKIKFANREDHQAENIRKMLLAMLEDLAFRYIDPFCYTQLATEINALRGEGEAFLQRIVTTMEAKLADAGIHARVESRIKRLYSIQQKLTKHAIPVEQVYDLFAVRVITQTEAECYAAFGLLHAIWRPVPGRFKDFIAMPRPNFYQSLHTTLIGEGGHQFEVQIRTEDMHRVAEEGVAAHWKYKATDAVTVKEEERLAWIRSMMESLRETSDTGEFMSTLKMDMYPEEVYTFTPKGKVIVLPKDASPIDFAYAIHTDVGHATVGAKVNGRIVPLRSRLRNGDIVEITTQTGHAPSRDWLSFTKSSRARNKIKHWLTENQRARAIEIGQKLLAREGKRYKISLDRFKTADYDRIANEYGLGGEQDLLAGIGFGKYSARTVLNKLEPGSTMPAEVEKPQPGALGNTLSHMSAKVKRVFFGKGSDTLQVEGQDDLLVYRARCCNPIRGEEIIGYVTRGKGVAVHARSCPNVQNLLYEADRRIDVEWAATVTATAVGATNGAAATYPVRLVILADDRSGLLKEFAAIISEDGTNIKSVETRPAEDDAVHVDFVIETLDLRHLTRLTQNLRKVPGVRTVHRVQKI